MKTPKVTDLGNQKKTELKTLTMTISFVKTPKVTDLGNQKKDRAKNFDYDRRRGLFFEPSSIYVSEKE